MKKAFKRNRRKLKSWTDLSDLKDIHKGRKCFVIGAGPSIAFLDLSPIQEEVVISVNSSILKMKWRDAGDITSRFWVSNDTLCVKWSYFWTHVLRANCTKVVRITWKKYDEDLRGYNFRYFATRKSDIEIDSANSGLCSQSSIPTAIDLSILLGCKQIYLLGVDHCMVHGNSHFWQFGKIDEWPHRKDKGAKFRPEQKHQETMFKKNIPVFEALKKFAQSKDVSIYNCSNKTKLGVFPKIPLDKSYV